MKIAILGMGTVGSGVFQVLKQYQSRKQTSIEISMIFARQIRNPHLNLIGIRVTDQIEEVLNSDVDLIVEVLGGVDFAYEVIKQSLIAGKHVVTANKDLLALHVEELSRLANRHQVQLAYEASCGGGIPIVNLLQEDLEANQIMSLKGILNGTTNFILTKMSQEGRTYEDVLKEAQEMGYAEKDPTSDVKGLDAFRKIKILSRLAYRVNPQVEQASIVGIDQVDLEDIRLGQVAGLTMKLLAWSQYEEGKLHMQVEPVFLENQHILSQVHQAKNAIFVEGDAIGQALFYGPGAGSLETASAVVADIIKVYRHGYMGNIEVDASQSIRPFQDARSYYVRLDKESHLEGIFDLISQKIEDDQSVAFISRPINLKEKENLENLVKIEALYPIEVSI